MLSEVERALQELESVELVDEEDIKEQRLRHGEMARRKAELQFNQKRNTEWKYDS